MECQNDEATPTAPETDRDAGSKNASIEATLEGFAWQRVVRHSCAQRPPAYSRWASRFLAGAWDLDAAIGPHVAGSRCAGAAESDVFGLHQVPAMGSHPAKSVETHPLPEVASATVGVG